MIRVVHPGSGSWIFTHPRLRIHDPGSRCQKGTGSRMRIRNTGTYIDGNDAGEEGHEGALLELVAEDGRVWASRGTHCQARCRVPHRDGNARLGSTLTVNNTSKYYSNSKIEFYVGHTCKHWIHTKEQFSVLTSLTRGQNSCQFKK